MSSMIENWRTEMKLKLQKLHITNELLQQEKKRLDSEKQILTSRIKAQEVLHKVAKEVEQRAHEQISKIISKCLAMIWDEPYQFQINFVSKAGRTEAEIKLMRDGHDLDPLDSTGGGVVDVAAFACRVACLSLRIPKGRAFIALDEPFKHVSPDLRPRIAAMLELLSEELGFQFLISTHMKALKVGSVVEL